MLTNEQNAILDYLADGKRRSAMEIGSWVGISTMRASIILRDLLELGYLKVGTHSVFGRGKCIDYRLAK
jgi:DNA-binding IclR family transcriptional regulator